MHKKNKLIIFYLTFTLLVIILILLSIVTIKKLKIKYISSKYVENVLAVDLQSPFTINKIVYFSSANCKSEVNPNSSFTINDLYQYTDFAIFINNNADNNLNSKNTLKSVSLSNIEYLLNPNLRNSMFVL